MRDSLKRRIAGGLFVAAIVVLLLGAYCMAEALRLHTRLEASEGMNVLEISADLSQRGTYAGRLVGFQGIAHAVNVFMTFDEPVNSEVECDALFGEVKGRWGATGPDGRIWLDRELGPQYLISRPSYPSRVIPLLRVSGYPEGDSTLTLTVNTPSAALAGRRCKLTAEHEYCGLEHLAATMMGAFGAGLILLSLVPLAIRRAIRRNLRHSNQASPEAGAGTPPSENPPAHEA